MTQMGVIDKWIAGPINRSVHAADLKRLYERQAEFLFGQYEPIKGQPDKNGLDFLQRLENWLNCFEDPEDKWAAFRTLRYFLFIGLAETEEMYRCAVQKHFLPWLIDRAKLDIFSPRFNKDLAKEIRKCWPCPISDSLRINSLLHCTGLGSQETRPDWYSLAQLGDKNRIKKYVKHNEIDVLLLFEDFVGSGSQCEKTIRFALEAFDGVIFFSPLMICAPGDEKVRALVQDANGRLVYAPVVVLSHECLIKESAIMGEPASFEALRGAMVRGYKKANVRMNGGAFGYGGVGCLYSSYSNCPNNAPPIYHMNVKGWNAPLFPRRSR